MNMTFKDVMQFYWGYLKAYRIQAVVIITSIIISTIFGVLAPRLLGDAIEELANYVTALFTGQTPTLGAFHGILLTLLLFYVFSEIASFINIFLIAAIAGNTTNRMRIKMFKKVERLAIRFFDTSKDGDILARFTSDMENIGNALQQYLIQVLGNIAWIIGIIWMMFRVNVSMALLTLSIAPLAWFVTILIVRKAKKYADLRQDSVGELNAYIDEKISGQKMIITTGTEEETKKGFKIHNKIVRQNSYRGEVYAGLLFPVMQGIGLINMAMVIFFGAYLTATGDIGRAAGLGLIVIFVQYSQRFYGPLTEVAAMYSQMQLAFVGARRVNEILVADEETQTPDAVELNGIEKNLELKDVEFGYLENKQVLKNLNIEVRKGKTVAVVGPTGSGKTTIMNLINRFYDVDRGRISIDGIDIRDFTLESLRRNVGIVLQDSILFEGTLRHNIAFGKPEATDEEVIEATTKAHIHDFIMSLEHGYDTEVSDENNILSTGQKQLISIARTVLTNPSLLILDEATSNVDTVTESHIQKAMESIMVGRTSFVIAHRLKTILNSNHIIVLVDGTVLEEGNHEQLLRKDGFYAELYYNQFVVD
jgi:ATP-binding cassette subfamily B multidrug efflux pump